MTRFTALFAIIFCALVSFAHAETSAADAQAALDAKTASRDKARAEIVQITAGELEDMRLKIRTLQTQIDSLRGSQSGSAAAPKHYTEIEIGMTKAEVKQFVQQHAPYMSIIGIRASNGISKSQQQVTVHENGEATVAGNGQSIVRRGREGTTLAGTGRATQVEGTGHAKVDADNTRVVEVVTNRGKNEVIEIGKWSFSHEQTGTQTGSFGQVHPVYSDVTHRAGTIRVSLSDDVVTGVDAN